MPTIGRVGLIVIGGTDALDRAQYAELLGHDGTHVDEARNGSDMVQPGLWVNCALERLVTAKHLSDPAAMLARKEAWAEAYRHTPHGKPVELMNSSR